MSSGGGLADRERALELLRRHGWNTTSFQLLGTFRYWFAGDDAFVAYVDTGSCWVVGGAPVAPQSRLAQTADSFVAAARVAGRRACFFAVEERFRAATGYPALLVGEQPAWDPRTWDDVLGGSSTLRYQLRRARAKGVTVRELAAREVADPDAPARLQVEALVGRWLHGRPMAPMGFLVDVEPFRFPHEHLYVVAEHQGRVVGCLSAVPIYARSGWFFENLLRTAEAPNGTAELLVEAGMRLGAARGAELVTLGLAPLAGRVAPSLRWAGILGAPLYDFRGLQAFKRKLRPQAWSPVYLCAARERSRWVALYDSLRAFARGSLFGFGLRTLARGPVGLVRILTLLLCVWTPLLALTPSAPWFPSAAVKWGWVGFDALLTAALWVLARRYRRWLGVTVATLATVDLAGSTLQGLVYNLARARGSGDMLVLALSWTGPALAAVALWGMVRHRSQAFAANLRPATIAACAGRSASSC